MTVGVGAVASERAFGAENRARLLAIYFDDIAIEPVTAASAWQHVYRLLMWVDRTIGLAHCYESDKCQPGRPWYARSLQFHRWLSAELGTTPAKLSEGVDWLFTSAVQDLTRARESQSALLAQKANAQRAPFAHDDMPLPGEDPELENMIEHAVLDDLGMTAPAGFAKNLSMKVQTYLASENKRKNLVGEGFEDTLAEVLFRIPSLNRAYDILLRPALHELPGFNPPRGGDKTKRVDLALVRRSDGRRTLVSCKWSIRSDREEQFATDFEAYAHLESSGEDFAYVLVTNEFDPARLAAACENRRQNAEMFTEVVHVNPAGPLAAYSVGLSQGRTDSRGIARARAHISSGRLVGLADWISSLY
ncbi:hypothetical protein [Agromyces sp. Marseille-P2726]|uniref:hypothetical protein n=1 Tax=Agromyces sp. Marseille-P2726 TaxID=2709132 RepID=UPI00156EEF64|nr:hypothetical protein [Agromyces sp. Marseille-P2726]